MGAQGERATALRELVSAPADAPAGASQTDAPLAPVIVLRGTARPAASAMDRPRKIASARQAPKRLAPPLHVSSPDAPARALILARLVKPHAPDLDVSCLVSRTDGWSAADLRLLVETAARQVWQDGLRSGRPLRMDLRDLKWALRCLHGQRAH